jgi:hypothetical protein
MRRIILRRDFAALFVFVLGAAPASAVSQSSAANQSPLDQPARLTIQNQPLDAALRALQASSGVAVAFSPDVIPATRRVTCDCASVTVRVALDRLLAGTGLVATTSGRQVLVGAPRPPELPSAALTGIVVEAGTGRALSGVEVALPVASRSVTTRPSGAFTFTGVEPNEYRLVATALGYQPAEVTVRWDPSTPPVRLTLVPVPIDLAELVIAPGSFTVLEAAPAGATTMGRERIEAQPQIADDAMRTLQRLPGVGSDDISTRLNVRGSTDRNLLFRLDGVQLYEPYHLKDLESPFGIVDVQALEGIDLLAGGFPVEYGDHIGGVFDMQSRTPPAEGRRTTVGLSFSTFSLGSQGTYADGRGQWLVAGRRGFLDLVLAIADVDDELSPAFYDVFARTRWLATDRHLFSAGALYAGDDVEWGTIETDSRIESLWSDGYAWLGWNVDLGGVRVENTLSGGRLKRDRIGFGGGDGAFTPIESRVDDHALVTFAGLRSDWQADLGPNALIKAGAELRTFDARYDYYSRAVRARLDENGQVTQWTDEVRVATTPDGISTGAWLGLRHRASNSFNWEGGVRFDRQGWTGESALGPRLLLSWSPSATRTVRASVGRYSQSQQINELQVADGESSFTSAETADMAALGLEQRVGQSLSARLDAYVRTVDDPRPEWVNLSRQVNAMQELEEDRAKLAGTRARAVGVELLLSGRAWSVVDWSGSYTWAKSDLELNGRWVPRTLDQRHTVNLFGALNVSDRWQISASWQLHTGWPFTHQQLDATVIPNSNGGPARLQVTRRFGPINAERLPTYHRLDLRATRTFSIGDGGLEVYLDVFNAYDRMNLRGYEYGLRRNGNVFTTSRSAGEGQFPLLPTLGARWTF